MILKQKRDPLEILLRIIGITQGLFLFMVFSSPFFWIWADWSIAWRVALTGIIGLLIMKLLYTSGKTIKKQLEDEQCKKTLESLTKNK